VTHSYAYGTKAMCLLCRKYSADPFWNPLSIPGVGGGEGVSQDPCWQESEGVDTPTFLMDGKRDVPRTISAASRPILKQFKMAEACFACTKNKVTVD
jgi:hypothetical protein